MKVEYKKLKDLKPYENNPRNNENAVEYVKNSIQEFGFRVPLVVDANNVIVCGHTRYKAAQELGVKEIACVVADDLTEEQINAFRLADNKTQELAEWDWNKIGEELGANEVIAVVAQLVHQFLLDFIRVVGLDDVVADTF